MTVFALGVEQFEQGFTTSLHAGGGIVQEVVPRIAAMVIVGRIDEEVVEPRQTNGLWHPTIAFHAITEPVQHDHQPVTVRLGGGDFLVGEHYMRGMVMPVWPWYFPPRSA